jgi:hypothetical protein
MIALFYFISFLLTKAAYLGVSDALKNAARIYLKLPHDILADFEVEVNTCVNFFMDFVNYLFPLFINDRKQKNT